MEFDQELVLAELNHLTTQIDTLTRIVMAHRKETLKLSQDVAYLKEMVGLLNLEQLGAGAPLPGERNNTSAETVVKSSLPDIDTREQEPIEQEGNTQ